LAGLLALIRAARGRGLQPGGATAIVVGIVFVVLASRGRGYPRINDFTTDLADPPTFQHASTLPANSQRDLSYPAPFAAEQRACCADLHPAQLKLPPSEALARARQVAQQMGWTVTQVDPAAGTLEAIATSRLFGFHDDVVVRVRPAGDGGSRVDVRSKSRDGKGDLGVNAARIRSYVTALEG